MNWTIDAPVNRSRDAGRRKTKIRFYDPPSYYSVTDIPTSGPIHLEY